MVPLLNHKAWQATIIRCSSYSSQAWSPRHLRVLAMVVKNGSARHWKNGSTPRKDILATGSWGTAMILGFKRILYHCWQYIWGKEFLGLHLVVYVERLIQECCNCCVSSSITCCKGHLLRSENREPTQRTHATTPAAPKICTLHSPLWLLHLLPVDIGYHRSWVASREHWWYSWASSCFMVVEWERLVGTGWREESKWWNMIYNSWNSDCCEPLGWSLVKFGQV